MVLCTRGESDKNLDSHRVLEGAFLCIYTRKIRCIRNIRQLSRLV